jgi:hypothetical protein
MKNEGLRNGDLFFWEMGATGHTTYCQSRLYLSKFVAIDYKIVVIDLFFVKLTLFMRKEHAT